MAEGLALNNTLLGVHMQGNEGKITAQGNLETLEDVTQQEFAHSSLLYTRVFNVDRCGQVDRKLRAVSNCWICEGWSNVRFQFTPSGKVDEKTVVVKLHLECDEYRGQLLQCLSRKCPEEPLIYVTERMLPPGDQRYYFTVGGATEEGSETLGIQRVNYVNRIVRS